MTDVIERLSRTALQKKAAAEDDLWMARYADLQDAGIRAHAGDLLGEDWGHAGWREACSALIRMVGQLSQEVEALKKERP